MAVWVLVVRIVGVLRLLGLSVVRRRRRSFPFLLLVDRDVRIDFPKSTFADLASLFESLTTNEVVSNTTLPAMSCTPVLEPGIHFLHGVVDLLQVHYASRSL
jgi:hypothetical protein